MFLGTWYYNERSDILKSFTLQCWRSTTMLDLPDRWLYRWLPCSVGADIDSTLWFDKYNPSNTEPTNQHSTLSNSHVRFLALETWWSVYLCKLNLSTLQTPSAAFSLLSCTQFSIFLTKISKSVLPCVVFTTMYAFRATLLNGTKLTQSFPAWIFMESFSPLAGRITTSKFGFSQT